MVGEPLPGDPLALISPSGSDGGAGLGVGALPAAAQICSCNNVTKGDLCDAIAEGCSDVPELKKCTLAGTSCGSCVPLLKQLLEAEGVEQSKALCEHFSQSRAELFSIIRGLLAVRTFSGLIERFGTGKGCDICKPAVASILASTSSDHILDGEQASLQDSNDHFLANIQKNGSYSVVPRSPGSSLFPSACQRRPKDEYCQRHPGMDGRVRLRLTSFLNRGVGVLLPDGAPAALFRLDDGSLHAVGNIDPFSGAAVMSRGIVGDRGGRATVQTPSRSRRSALTTASVLDDPDVALPVYATRINPEGVVEVGA